MNSKLVNNINTVNNSGITNNNISFVRLHHNWNTICDTRSVCGGDVKIYSLIYFNVDRIKWLYRYGRELGKA